MSVGRSLDSDTIRNLIVPIVGYDELQQRLLVGELQRYRESLEWVEAGGGGSLLDIGSRGDLVPVYERVLGYGRVVCLDGACANGPFRLTHADGSIFDFEACRMDVEREPFPFPDATFDQVMATEILEHLAVDPMFMLAEANRVLRPRGSLLLTTPNAISLSCLYRMLWSRHPGSGRQAFGPGLMDRHHREYVPQDVVALLEAAGFEVVRIDTFNPKPLSRPVRHIGSMLRALQWLRRDIDVAHRGDVIRCACVKVGGVRERFPEPLYPRYRYYDYAAYDRQLTERFGGRRYWKSGVRVAGRDT